MTAAAPAKALPWELIRPHIVVRWPAVDEQVLAQTEGEREAVVALIAARTQHTRTLVRRHLAALQAQLAAVAEDEEEEQALVVAQDSALVLDPQEEEQLAELVDTVKQGKRELTDFARQLPGIIKQKLLAKWLISLAASLGAGLVLGILARSLLIGRGRAAAAAQAEAARPRQVSITVTLP